MALDQQQNFRYCARCNCEHFGPCPYAGPLTAEKVTQEAVEALAKVSDTDIELRKFALTLASNAGGEGSASKGVVNRAKNYLAFLKGEGPTGDDE